MQFCVKFEQKSIKPVGFCVILCNNLVKLVRNWKAIVSLGILSKIFCGFLYLFLD